MIFEIIQNIFSAVIFETINTCDKNIAWTEINIKQKELDHPMNLLYTGTKDQCGDFSE